ncbi:ribonuclease H-like domain-containing protein [Tanacetum coccineum]|uniref:Ribonuclease H-like domain-containing protein n=1 Tax=Tanacetum coccineum TaxID=301880 RepID=A0ABQ5IDZ4_9ASTR
MNFVVEIQRIKKKDRTHSNSPHGHSSQAGIVKPIDRLSLHTSPLSPIPKSPFLALKDPNWSNAMHDEYNALVKNGSWILVPKPSNVNLVRSMWLFKHKFHADGTPVVKPATIRTVLGLVVSRRWPIPQLDVKNAFLNGDLSETGSLYGLKQAPRAWFQRFAGYATRAGFSPSRCDSSLFIYTQGSQVAYLLIYVDGIILTASSSVLLRKIIDSLHKEFDMTDLGALNYFLGISAVRHSTGLFLSQKKYALQLLERAHMVNCNPSRTPVDTDSKLGPDGVPVQDPTLYRSLAGGTSGTLDLGLHLYASATTSLVGYIDADWVGCPSTRRSTSVIGVFLGKACIIEEFVNDAFDSALDSNGMEDEVGEEVVRVLTTIAGDNALHKRSMRYKTIDTLVVIILEVIGIKSQDIVMSDSEDSIVTYMEAPPSPDYVPGPKEPEQAPPSPEFVLEPPPPAAVSPTTDSPGYIADSDPEEDPEEDPADYPADGGDDDDDDDEVSNDNEDDEDDVEGDKDEEEEEEHPAPADSVPPPVHRILSPPLPVSSLPLPTSPTYPLGYGAAMIRLRAETPSTSHPLPSSIPPSGTPPILPLPTLSPPLLLPSTVCRAGVFEVTLPPRKRLCIASVPRYEVGESSSAPTARPTGGFRADYGFVGTLDDEIKQDLERYVDFVMTVRHDTDEIYVRLDDAQDERLLMSGQLNMLRRDRRAHARTARLMETEARLSREAWVQSMDASDIACSEDTADTGVANALAARDADRSLNDEDNHDSGMGVRRQAPPARECTYPDFMKCKPLYFKGTEGVVELTQWFDRMETVFRISNCSVENQIKFATCTLLGSALT